ncbi:MAG: outer membrane protein assembly factor BamD [Spirochaetes bacterium]|nr:outer membrane protein assembly factor BamD [Spirochaetota bacterium]
MKLVYLVFIIVLFNSFCYTSEGSVVNSIFNVGMNAYNRGDYDTAIKNLEIIYNEYPESPLFPKACMYLGYLYYDIGDLETSKKYLNTSIRASRKGSEVWKNAMKLLAVVYYETGDLNRYERAMEEIGRYNNLATRDLQTRQQEYDRKEFKPQSQRTFPTRQTQKNIPKGVQITNYITNIVFITNTNEQVITITNYLTDLVIKDTQSLPEIKEKVDEITKKEEELEELSRLTDVKNRLLKLNEKILMLQEILDRKAKEEK